MTIVICISNPNNQMTEITNFDYHDSGITFSGRDDVMINATEMAKVFGKRPNDWLNLPSTKEFLNTLSKVRKSHSLQTTGKSRSLIKTVEGRNGGTWFHEDVAIEFARWLSPEFAIWCNDRIKELLKAENKSLKEENQRLLSQSPFPVCKKSITIRSLANFISTYTGKQIGQNKLFNLLREWGYLQICESHYNEPYQKYINNNFFEVLVKNDRIVTLATPKGQKYISKRFIKSLPVPITHALF